MNKITFPQQNILIDVAFYDDVEEKKLLTYTTASTMQQLVSNPVSLPTAEFLTYLLFHRKGPGRPGYKTYKAIGRKLRTALSILDECITFNGQSISTPPNLTKQLTEISEHVGEAIGLSIISRIHGLTEADWSILDSMKGRSALPSFDFQIASDGVTFVQVENKGSSVLDNSAHPPAVKAQYKKIQDKKYKLANLPTGKNDPYPASLRYGTIVALDPNPNGNVRCWLTDPPPDTIDQNPRNFRVTQRLTFIHEWISFLSPRSQLSASLSTRLADLKHINNPFDLNRIPLYKGNNDSFEYSIFGEQNFSFLSNKSRLINKMAGGIVVQFSDTQLMFLGIREELIQLVASQDFEDISNYKSESSSKTEQVKCVFSQRRFKTLRLPASMNIESNDMGGYQSFKLDGVIHFSAAGLVFGLLDLPKE